jgi:ABC-type branched-subunit amino acid transport system ATPase component
VIAPDWLFRQDWAGSSQPFVDVAPLPLGPGLGTPSSMLGVYYVAFGVLVLGIASAVALRNSNVGRLVLAVRDNERASAAFGVNPATMKLAILAVSGFFAGAAGVIYADVWRVVGPTQFTPDFSIALLALPVIGGLGSVAGAVAASVLLYSLTFFIGPSLSGLFGDGGNSLGFQLFLAGGGQVAILLAYPSGLAGFAQERWQAVIDRIARGNRSDAAPLDDTEEVAFVPPPRVEAVRRRIESVTDDELPLVTSGITVRFGGVMALDQPELVVRPGEIVGLIGPNGAGKSTLINVVSGVVRADRGSVRVFGKEVADLPPDLRPAFGVARSFQDASLFAGLTVAETLQVALSRRYRTGVVSAMVGAPWVQASEVRSRRHAEQLAARFGLTPWLDALTTDLSTGTRRICDLAAQVAAHPRLLLLDEPTGGVAQREAEAFAPILRQVRDDLDCAILIVEHDMPLLMDVCDRMYAMVAGGVIAEGTPEEIRHDPFVVASYLGADETAIARSGPTARTGAGR